MNHFIEGLTLGLAYAMPLGMQNLYVINSSLDRGIPSSYQLAALISIADISLAIACFYGVGTIIEHHPLLQKFYLIIGFCFFIYLGISIIKNSNNNTNVNFPKKRTEKFSIIFVKCFLITWLNIQAVLDGSLLFGVSRLSLAAKDINSFLLGMIIASPAWFFSLTTCVGYFRNTFSNKVFKIINIACGSILLIFSIKIAFLLHGILK